MKVRVFLSFTVLFHVVFVCFIDILFYLILYSLKFKKKENITFFEIKNNFLVRVNILPVVTMNSINKFV